MPELPDDHVDSIKAGTLVYWMDQDEDVPRGAVGEVHDMDGNDCVVEFPKRKIHVPVSKLNVSDFQTGTFIHLTDDGLADDTMGQVKGTTGENGKLLIEIEGEEKEVKPKYLFKCDCQIGMFVMWKKSDDDIPAGHVGQVLDDLNEKGKVKIKFPNGCWRFRPKDLVKSHVQPGSYVQWTNSDDDVGEGEIGEATGEGCGWPPFLASWWLTRGNDWKWCRLEAYLQYTQTKTFQYFLKVELLFSLGWKR